MAHGISRKIPQRIASPIRLSRTLPLPHQPVGVFLLPLTLGRISLLPWWAENGSSDPLWQPGKVIKGDRYFFHMAFSFLWCSSLEPSHHLARKPSSYTEMPCVGVLAVWPKRGLSNHQTQEEASIQMIRAPSLPAGRLSRCDQVEHRGCPHWALPKLQIYEKMDITPSFNPLRFRVVCYAAVDNHNMSPWRLHNPTRNV